MYKTREGKEGKMDTGLAKRLGECVVSLAVEEKREEKQAELRRLNLVCQNYVQEEAALKKRLAENPDDVVRRARLLLIQQRLLPAICDLILRIEISMG